ncbi:MAG: hypothetical protein AB7H48_02395 [Parachlamydiales bacterium]
MKFTGTLLLAGLLSLPIFSHAEEHPLSVITGTEIDLKTYDHAFAGSIKKFVVWGNIIDEHAFKSELIMKNDGQTIRANFEKTEKSIGGTIKHDVEGRTIETSLAFDKIDSANSTLFLTRNGKPVEVKIAAEDFKDKHFKNPVYTVTWEGGTFEYALKGDACWAYSLNLAFLIVGAYTH